MKCLLVLFLSLLPSALMAGPFPDDSVNVNSRLLRQDGQLVSIRIAVGEPIRIYVVGREEAKLDLKNLKLEVRRISPYPGTVLNLTREKDHYVITDKVDLDRENEIELTTKVKDKTESLKFKIKSRLP
jgi:hypothetical protein